MHRVLKVGGRCLVYAWAQDQEHGKKKSHYLTDGPSGGENGEEPAAFGLPVHTNRTNFKHADLLVPWKLVLHLCTAVFSNLLDFHIVYLRA
jgi:alkylated DNA repair protein alkB family protein 8